MPEPKVSDVIKALKTGSARELITLEGIVVPSGAKIGRLTYETAEDAAILQGQFPALFGARPAVAPGPYRFLAAHGIPVSQRIDAFVDYLKAKNKTSRYVAECKRVLEILIDIAGDLAPDDYTPEVIDTLMVRVTYLPLNPEKNKEHRDRWAALSYAQMSHEAELMEMQCISDVTRRKHVARLSAFFAFCHRRQFMHGGNPMADRAGEPDQTKGSSPAVKAKRLPFSADDMAKIFDRETYRSRKLPHSFWPPLIALATGARVNEIAQLYLDDIVDDDAKNPGRYRFMILPKRPDQRVKNEASIRSIPMLPILIEMGFLHYLSDVRRLGYARVFPTLQYTAASGYGDTISEFFSGYLRNKVCIVDRKKVFHSFRHWFCTELYQRSKNERMHIVSLTGHARQGEFEATYARELHYEEKLAQLMKLPLPTLTIEPYKPGGFDGYFKSYERNKIVALRKKAEEAAQEKAGTVKVEKPKGKGAAQQ